MSQIDAIDCRLLEQLQRDATISLDALAEESGISLNTVWRRIKRLEANGILEGRVAMVDNEKVGLPLTVFVRIRTDDHSAAWAKALTKAVANIPEIVEFYRLAGDVDYILKLIVASVADYDRVYQALTTKVSINDVAASFAMEKLKFTTELPIKPTG